MSEQTTLFGETKTRVGDTNMDHTTVYIGRGDNGESHMLNTEIGNVGWLGNPFPKRKHGRAQCVEMFRSAFEQRIEEDEAFRKAIRGLHGEILGCHCQRINDDGPACHGEVIAGWANKLAEEGEIQ